MRQSRNPLHGVVASYNPEQGGLEKTMAFINPLALTWELDFWQKNRALLDAAIGEAAAQAGETRQSRLLLTTGVARAYLRGYALTQQSGLATTLVKMRRELRALAETRYQTGLDTLDGVQIARTNEEVAVRREATVKAAITLQRDALARLMGEGPDAGLTASQRARQHRAGAARIAESSADRIVTEASRSRGRARRAELGRRVFTPRKLCFSPPSILPFRRASKAPSLRQRLVSFRVFSSILPRSAMSSPRPFACPSSRAAD